MLKQASALCGLSVAVLMVSSCAQQSALDLPPGKYEKNVSSTDQNGVTTQTKDTTNVAVDANGHKTATVQSKTTEEPPGLLGAFEKKTTHESTQVLEGENSQ